MLARICYALGDWISHPMTDYDWGWLYPPYAKLMHWSSELDTEGAIWSNADNQQPTNNDQ